MTSENPITVGIFDGFSWIRCDGKGSFLNSPAVKSFGDQRIAAGEKLLVVDLGECSGMDSTFMGTLAGLAARLSAQGRGVLQVAEPGERNRRSLEDLGLDLLIEIDPPSAAWRGRAGEIRSHLAPPQSSGQLPRSQRTRLVLDAHQNLSEINETNAREFASVIDMLENDIKAASARRDAGHPGNERPVD